MEVFGEYLEPGKGWFDSRRRPEDRQTTILKLAATLMPEFL
jgi:hypothetical protein